MSWYSNFCVFFGWQLVCVAFLTGCPTKKLENPDVLRLQTKLTEVDEELKGMEEKIKAAEYDRGLQIQLGHENELLKARRDRILGNLKRLGASAAAPVKKEE